MGKNIVAGLFVLHNVPGFHGNGRMLKLGQSFEILQWMWGVFSMSMSFFIMPSSELGKTYSHSTSHGVQLRVMRTLEFS